MTHSTLKKIDETYLEANSIKQLIESEKMILKSIESSPNQPHLIWRLARNNFQIAKRTTDKKQKLSLFEDCLSTANKGISIDKNSAENIYYMGLCLGNISLQRGILSSLSNRKLLKTAMGKALKINPNVEHAGPHRFLGVYYNVLPFFLGGDSKKAVSHLESAVALAPDHAENHFFLGKVYFENGYYSKANAALKHYLKLARNTKNDPDMPKQIEEAGEFLTRIKTFQSDE
jgi:tetratricopeptide (TPR) repeat protein